MGRSIQPTTVIGVRIGPGRLTAGDLSLSTTAVGWAGFVGRTSVEVIGSDSNPIGAYLAACLTVGEIFKHVCRVRPDASTTPLALWIDGYSLQLSREIPEPTPLLPPIRLANAVVVGAGAVANGLLHTLYPLQGVSGSMVLIDHDEEGITDTNLNRCVLFDRNSYGRPKASVAAMAFTPTNRGICIEAVNGSFETWYTEQRSPTLDLVISAVDRNQSRHAIQDAMPRLILGASTNEMRAQVVTYDPLSETACLRCRNRAESLPAEQDIIERLRTLDSTERSDQAKAAGVDPALLDTFLADPIVHCGTISGPTLGGFAVATSAPEWSVGFVSVFAGVILASEHIKRSVAGFLPTLAGTRNTYNFQLWHPEHETVNRAIGTPAENTCLCQTKAFKDAFAGMWKAS